MTVVAIREHIPPAHQCRHQSMWRTFYYYYTNSIYWSFFQVLLAHPVPLRSKNHRMIILLTYLLLTTVTVVPPLYQLVLVAATEGSIFHVIVTAAFWDGRTTVTCAGNTTQTQSTHISVLLLFVLHHLLVTRLYD